MPKLKTNKPEVTYQFDIEQEEIQVRGNAMCSGDAKADKEAEDDILRAMDRGEMAAWCCAIVTASIVVEGKTYSGKSTLGCCSYASEAAIEKDLLTDNTHGLKEDALFDLQDRLKQDVQRGHYAARALKVLAKVVV